PAPVRSVLPVALQGLLDHARRQPPQNVAPVARARMDVVIAAEFPGEALDAVLQVAFVRPGQRDGSRPVGNAADPEADIAVSCHDRADADDGEIAMSARDLPE